MKPIQKVFSLVTAAACLTFGSTAHAQLNIPGANGSDGVFNPTKNTTIDLAAATNPGSWDSDNTANQGKGVYDPAKWGVVFKYTSVNIPTGVTVTFKNHASRAPVVWLVSGDVVISGKMNLDGNATLDSSGAPSEPGPGGFRGGSYGSGYGPGGANHVGNNGAGYASYSDSASDFNGIGNTTGTDARGTYGNTRLLPLLGGSGGLGLGDGRGGGAGGGAILIACRRHVSIAGQISSSSGVANGGGGTGGAIRVIADQITGAGSLIAGRGRIRIEAISYSGNLQVYPSTIIVLPDAPPLIWPRDNAPQARIVSVDGHDIITDPVSNLGLPSADINIQNDKPVDILIETRNLDVSSAIVRVSARVTPRNGAAFVVLAKLSSGTAAQATWIATTKIPDGFAAIQVRAVGP